jgi:ankyrin repeat protein
MGDACPKHRNTRRVLPKHVSSLDTCPPKTRVTCFLWIHGYQLNTKARKLIRDTMSIPEQTTEMESEHAIWEATPADPFLSDDHSEPEEDEDEEEDEDDEDDEEGAWHDTDSNTEPDEEEEPEEEDEDDEDMASTLWNACDEGDEATVERLILPDANGVSPVSVRWIEDVFLGKTPLLIAVIRDHDRIVQMLLKAGASIKATYKIRIPGMGNGFTAMTACAMGERTTIMQNLLEHDPDSSAVNMRSATGFAAIDFAVSRNRIDMVRAMLKHGADVNLLGRRGDTPLFTATVENNTEMIEILLAHGANPLHENDYGETALTNAAWNQNIKAVEMILDAGGDINHQNAKRVSVLHSQAKWNHLVMAKYLLERGASIDLKSKSGRTPSEVAAKYGNVKMSNLIKAEGLRRTQCEAFCMCLHQRLGERSPWRSLDEGVVRMISNGV